MAGKRLSDNNAVELNGNALKTSDAFVITSAEEDRILAVLDLQKVMRDGSGLEGEDKDNLTFFTKAQAAEITAPSEGLYKIEGGEIKSLGDDGQWYCVLVSKSGKALSWGGVFSVSVDANGVVQFPQNFVKANNLVTATGGQLSALKAGVGIVGDSFNGSQPATWKIDSEWVKTLIQNTQSREPVLTADGGEKVKLKCRVTNGIPQFYGEVVNE